MRRPLLIVVSAPSGTGKTTLCRMLVERLENADFSVSVTSRDPRPGEVQGRDYLFVSEEEFREKIDSGGFLEWAVVHDRYYGTSKDFVRESLGRGNHVVFDIDVQGGMRIRENQPEAVLIFLLPPSMEELRRRLVGRNQDGEDEIEKRIGNSYREMRRALDYDYLVENRDLDEALEMILSIITAEKCRVR